MLLLLKRVDPEWRDADGRTPLSLASGRGFTAVVKLLLEAIGVDPNSEDFEGMTPLSWASAEGHQGAI